jgi:segregation and condensation protein B
MSEENKLDELRTELDESSEEAVPEEVQTSESESDGEAETIEFDETASADALVEISAMGEEIEPILAEEISEEAVSEEVLNGESESDEELEAIGFDETASADALVEINAMGEEIEPILAEEISEEAVQTSESELDEELEAIGIDETVSADAPVEISAMGEEIIPILAEEIAEEVVSEEVLNGERESDEELEAIGFDETASADALVEISAMGEEIEPILAEEIAEEVVSEEVLNGESESDEELEAIGFDETVSADALVEISAMGEEIEPVLAGEISEEAVSEEVLNGESESDEELEAIGIDETPSTELSLEDEITAAREEIKPAIESLLFVAEEPLPFKSLCKLLGEVSEDDVRAALDELLVDYDARKSGLEIREIGGGWRISTRPQNHDFIRKYLKSRPSARLSLPALETLAVIAYKQPITIPEILEIRGVTSSSAIKTLLEKRLIVTKGRKETVGRPMLYGTSKEFLIQFGLKDLTELPSIEDFEDLAQ